MDKIFYTEAEIRAAKQLRDEIIEFDRSMFIRAFRAGEACMWDKMNKESKQIKRT